MIYETGGRQVDPKRTQIKLDSNYELYHEYAQFIENYARTMFEEHWDMSKLHFYNSDPAKENAEVSPEEAFEQLNSGYPIFVKHENSPEVLPFMKRRDNIYTGEDFVQVEKHPQVDLGFDYEEFLKAPIPPRPSVWQYILGFFGFGDETYTNYQTYKEKSEQVRSMEYSIKKEIAENDGYRYASEIFEHSTFREDITRIAKTPVEELKNAAEKSKQSVREISDEEIEAGDNLNINDLLGEATPKNIDKPAPQVPEEIQQELDARDAAIEKRELMKNSAFMKDVLSTIRMNQGADESEILRGVEFVRTMHKDVPEEITTKEFIEYANTLILTEDKKNEADASMKSYTDEHFNKLGDKIANAITDQLLLEEEGLNREDTYKAVRFGPTLKKMMTADPLYPARLATLGEENPAELTRKYKVRAAKDAEKEKQKQQKKTAQKDGKEAVKNDAKVLH